MFLPSYEKILACEWTLDNRAIYDRITADTSQTNGGTMFTTIDAFYDAAQPLIEAFNRSDVEKLRWVAQADHLCYKCGSHEEFEHLRRLFETECQFLYQSMISNRLIAIIKLPRAIPTLLGEIWFLELSDQKPDASQTSRFDHVEIYSKNKLAEWLADHASTIGIVTKRIVRPHHTTYDIPIDGGFLVRFEDEPLVDKIKRDEMK